jgi:hypothetical protein
MRRRLLSTLCVLFALAALVTAPAQAAPATTGDQPYASSWYPGTDLALNRPVTASGQRATGKGPATGRGALRAGVS